MKLFSNFAKSVKPEAFKFTIQSTEELIEEIHNEFNTAGYKLLKEAQTVLDQQVTINVNKAERLKAIGFTGTSQVKELEEINRNQRQARKQAETIQYYATHYPNNRFITEEAVARICNKYSLVKGEISRYKGFVPEKNLREIEQFKLRKEDMLVSRSSLREELHKFSELPSSVKKGFEDGMLIKKYFYDEFRYKWEILSRFFICAPVKDMDLRGAKVDGYNIVRDIPDPVVLCPVGTGQYLIVSAWGAEASDPEVVNHKMN